MKLIFTLQPEKLLLSKYLQDSITMMAVGRNGEDLPRSYILSRVHYKHKEILFEVLTIQNN